MSSTFTRRVLGEIQKMKKELPLQCKGFHVNEDNLRVFYFLCFIDEEPFLGGEYIVKFELPDNYPFAPPKYFMLTPNGRFNPEIAICNTFSNYHPSEFPTSISLSTLLTMFVRHLQSNDEGIGVLRNSRKEREDFAKNSKTTNKEIMQRCGIKSWYKNL